MWWFAADRDLPPRTLQAVRAWLPTWTSHGRPVTAEADVVADCVLVVGAVIAPEDWNAGVSGCGIDAMTHVVERAFTEAGVAQVPALSVTYREANGPWQTVPRPAFRRLAREGAVTGATRVLDLTATDLAAARAHGVDRPAAEAWHGRAFRLGAARLGTEADAPA